jgi:hypothetical protein
MQRVLHGRDSLYTYFLTIRVLGAHQVSLVIIGTSAYVSTRQHTSAYVSIRQHTSAHVSIRQHLGSLNRALIEPASERASERERVQTPGRLTRIGTLAGDVGSSRSRLILKYREKMERADGHCGPSWRVDNFSKQFFLVSRAGLIEYPLH